MLFFSPFPVPFFCVGKDLEVTEAKWVGLEMKKWVRLDETDVVVGYFFTFFFKARALTPSLHHEILLSGRETCLWWEKGIRFRVIIYLPVQLKPLL